MIRSDRIAILISLVAVLASYLVTEQIFESMAHIEDEMAYVWQARAITGGQIMVPSPPEPKSFLVPFVVDYNGMRFGKYPLGWPILLSLGERLGIRSLINPLLAGLSVWLTYLLGKRTLGETVGLIAAGLTLTSPYFLMNSGSLLSHPMGLTLSAAFALAWLDAFLLPKNRNRWLPTIVAAGTLGTLILTRPLTAIAVALPFFLHGIYLLLRGEGGIRLRLIVLGMTVLVMGSLHLVWQYALTGDWLLNPYTLWWEYDKVGFGPGYGHTSSGHTIDQAWINTRHAIRVARSDLFGWGTLSWIFMPFGLWAIRRNLGAWLLASIFPSLVIIYLAYWIGSWLFGPRYFYEGLYSLTLLSAAGVAQIAGWPTAPDARFPNYEGWRRIRPLATTALVALLVSVNLIIYTPTRLKFMHALYGVQRSDIDPFLTTSAQELTPALIIVHPAGKWHDYGSLLEIQDPYFTTPFVFIYSRGTKIDMAVREYFPNRKAYHYYTDEPYTFYEIHQPDR